MQIIRNYKELSLNQKSAVAIGKFDGIHVGHQKLLEKIFLQKQNGLQAVVFTFDPSPAVFFTGQKFPELTTKEEKRLLFEELGVDVLMEYPLTKESAGVSPENFIKDILVDGLQASYIAAGVDLSFGAQGAGDYKMLQNYGAEYGYQVEIIEKVMFHDEEISSSMVRKVVREGKMEEAELLLGDAYSISGIVAHGNRLGRTIGMPTANLLPPEEKLLPPNGVYFSEVQLGEKVYKGITNIGRKPTVSDVNQIGVETYLYDFAQDVYGQKITVRLFSFKRPEQKFESLDALKNQMAKDIAEGRYYKH